MSHINFIMSEHDNKFIYKWLLSISRKICDLCSSGQEDVHILLDKCSFSQQIFMTQLTLSNGAFPIGFGAFVSSYG